MNVIERLAVRLLGRGRDAEGAELIDDVLELYRERRRTGGRLYAGSRAAWDFLTLCIRPQFPAHVAEQRAGRRGMGRFVDDASQAWRAMWRRPAVSFTAMATLTVGIALSILAYVIVDGVMLRPLPYPRSDELVSVYSEFRPESGYSFARFALSGPEISDYKTQSRSIDIAAWQPGNTSLLEPDGTAVPVTAIRASSDVFRLLEAPPAIGRTLTSADDQPGAPCAVVLSHVLWQERFGAQHGALGRRITLSSESCEIVGVMPPEFGFPSRNTRAWLPLSIDRDPNTRANHGVVALGRLKSGQTFDAAKTELATLMAAWAREYPHHRGHGIVIAPLKEDVVGPVSQQLIVLAWAVGLVLILITANVAGLLLAHGEARQPEFAVRAALGASRTSLVRQLFLEGLFLAGAAGLAGGVVAWAVLEPLLTTSPHGLPRAAEIRIGLEAVAYAALIALASGTLIGLLPAIRLTRGNLSSKLKTGERGQSLSFNLRTQSALVVGELGLAVALTAAAILLVQSFVRLQQVPIGFETGGAMTATLSVPDVEEDVTAPQRFFVALIERLGSLPGVQAVGAISSLPMHDNPPPDDFTIEGRRVPAPSEPGYNAHYIMVTPGAFEALGIQVTRGRAIQSRDTPAAPGVALINEAAAANYWPGVDPLGRRVRYATGVADGQWTGWGPWLTIVGVAKDVRFDGLTTAARPAIYVAHAQRPRASYTGSTMAVVLRHGSGMADAPAAIRRAARELHGAATVSAPRLIESVVADDLARPRFMGWIMGVFAAVGLGIAAVGVYGVVAYGVARRTREIGVRMALGSSRGAVAWLIGRQTLALLAGGFALGAAAAAWMGGYLRAVLFGIQPYDAATYGVVAGLLGIVVCMAVVLPIRRAMAVDPLTALRSE